MPHKRNPVSATVILAAQAAAPGHLSTLLGAMPALHERPAGLWHAEWHALPSLFGLASGAFAEGRRLADGLDVDPGRMAANLQATKGLLFADAAAAKLTGALGRERAHALLEAAASRVRDTGEPLRAVLEGDPAVAGRLSAADLDAAFDPGPAVRAAGPWIDRALDTVARARTHLST